MLIYDYHTPHRTNRHLYPTLRKGKQKPTAGIPTPLLRKTKAKLPQVSELEVVRHYTKLSQKNFSITTQTYPLGSCTMKYNPWVCHQSAMHPSFLDAHPYAPDANLQGTYALMYHLQQMLSSICGMSACSLMPMAGAQGELAGMLMIRKYLHDKKLHHKNTVLVPTSAHGTNPASAVMSGFTVVEVESDSAGNVCLTDLKRKLNKNVAAIMLTNPSTYGTYEPHCTKIASMVHAVGGLLYYDGANLNAILGKVRPGDIGFDVMHSNLHKTFATPHGGGGPGSGAVLCKRHLEKYLPPPRIYQQGTRYRQSNGAESKLCYRPPLCRHGQCRRFN